LHDGDQPHVAAKGLGHEHHCRRGAGRRPPDRGRAGEHSQAREDVTEDGGEEYDRANQDEEHRPSAKNRHHDLGRDGARDEAADETLSDNKAPGRNRHAPFEPGQKDGRSDCAKHEGGGQAHQFESRDADDGRRE
jgi:hypothetical protein